MRLLTHLRYGVWLAVIFAIGLIVPTAHAQSSDRPQDLPSAPAPDPSDPPDSPDQRFHLGPTPYLWFSGIHGTVGALGHDSSVHASASDVLSNFDIGFMILAEPSYNRIVFPIDYMWVKLSDSKGLPFDQGNQSPHFNQPPHWGRCRRVMAGLTRSQEPNFKSV
jgi:hypothetical protein